MLRFSFRCGSEYHAPTDCETIRQWLTKCADDSETANYISAHTKVQNDRYFTRTLALNINFLFQGMSEVPNLYRKERRMQSHAVLRM